MRFWAKWALLWRGRQDPGLGVAPELLAGGDSADSLPAPNAPQGVRAHSRHADPDYFETLDFDRIHADLVETTAQRWSCVIPERSRLAFRDGLRGAHAVCSRLWRSGSADRAETVSALRARARRCEASLMAAVGQLWRANRSQAEVVHWLAWALASPTRRSSALEVVSCTDTTRWCCLGASAAQNSGPKLVVWLPADMPPAALLNAAQHGAVILLLADSHVCKAMEGVWRVTGEVFVGAGVLKNCDGGRHVLTVPATAGVVQAVLASGGEGWTVIQLPREPRTTHGTGGLREAREGLSHRRVGLTRRSQGQEVFMVPRLFRLGSAR